MEHTFGNFSTIL
jgi:hypothetical protein